MDGTKTTTQAKDRRWRWDYLRRLPLRTHGVRRLGHQMGWMRQLIGLVVQRLTMMNPQMSVGIAWFSPQRIDVWGLFVGDAWLNRQPSIICGSSFQFFSFCLHSWWPQNRSHLQCLIYQDISGYIRIHPIHPNLGAKQIAGTPAPLQKVKPSLGQRLARRPSGGARIWG